MRNLLIIITTLLSLNVATAQEVKAFDPSMISKNQQLYLKAFNDLKGQDRYKEFDAISSIFPMGETHMTKNPDGSYCVKIDNPGIMMTTEQLYALIGQPDQPELMTYYLSPDKDMGCELQFLLNEKKTEVLGFVVTSCEGVD